MTIEIPLRPMGAAFLVVAAVPLWSQAPHDLGAFLDSVAARLTATAAYKNWTASAVQTITEADRNDRPEKVTVVTKTVRVSDGRRREEVLKALETENGKTLDISSRYEAQARDRREQEERRRSEEERRPQEGRPEGRCAGRMDIEELLPFGAERRPNFQFSLRETTGAAGRPLVLLDVKAKTKDQRNWEGTYTIDPAVFDILRAEIRPSKMPKMVNELSVEADVRVLDGT